MGKTVKPRKLTPKERVLKKYPRAHAWQWLLSKVWVIQNLPRSMVQRSGSKTARAAWAAAARRLKGG